MRFLCFKRIINFSILAAQNTMLDIAIVIANSLIVRGLVLNILFKKGNYIIIICNVTVKTI